MAAWRFGVANRKGRRRDAERETDLLLFIARSVRRAGVSPKSEIRRPGGVTGTALAPERLQITSAYTFPIRAGKEKERFPHKSRQKEEAPRSALLFIIGFSPLRRQKYTRRLSTFPLCSPVVTEARIHDRSLFPSKPNGAALRR